MIDRTYHMYAQKEPYYGPVPVVDPPWYYTECGLMRKNDDCAPIDNVTCGNCKRTKRYREIRAAIDSDEVQQIIARLEAAMEL